MRRIRDLGWYLSRAKFRDTAIYQYRGRAVRLKRFRHALDHLLKFHFVDKAVAELIQEDILDEGAPQLMVIDRLGRGRGFQIGNPGRLRVDIGTAGLGRTRLRAIQYSLPKDHRQLINLRYGVHSSHVAGDGLGYETLRGLPGILRDAVTNKVCLMPRVLEAILLEQEMGARLDLRFSSLQLKPFAHLLNQDRHVLVQRHQGLISPDPRLQ